MAPTTKDALQKWGAILGIAVALLTITAAARALGDDRYVRRADYQRDIGDMKADLRVLRCRVAKDCE